MVIIIELVEYHTHAGIFWLTKSYKSHLKAIQKSLKGQIAKVAQLSFKGPQKPQSNQNHCRFPDVSSQQH